MFWTPQIQEEPIVAGHHHHVDPEAGDRRVFFAIAVNLGLTVVQIVGGVLSGSLALVADAIHNFSDAISLVIAFAARKIARQPANAQMTFGYGRAEIVAALVNYTTLIVIAAYLVYEGVLRLFDPQPVDGWLVVVIAGVALLVDVVTALLTFSMSKNSMNIRAAFLHNVADALGSVAVIVAGTLILLYDWRLIDPLVTLGIAGYILWMTFSEIGGAIRILMLGSPSDLESADVAAAIETVDQVADVHHVHLWQIDEYATSLEAHIAVEAGAWNEADAIKDRIRALLVEKFGITHSMLEMECHNHMCEEPDKFGHDADEVPSSADHGHAH